MKRGSVGSTRLLLMPKCCLFQIIFSLAGRLCSGGKSFDLGNVIFAAYFILRGHYMHIDFLRLLFLVNVICSVLFPKRSAMMIDGSENTNDSWNFELQNSHVLEKHSKFTVQICYLKDLVFLSQSTW